MICTFCKFQSYSLEMFRQYICKQDTEEFQLCKVCVNYYSGDRRKIENEYDMINQSIDVK